MDPIDAFLLFAAVLLASGVVLSLVARRRAARVLGAPVVADRVVRSPLRLVPIAAAMVVVFLAGAEPLPLVVVVLSAALCYALPDHRVRALGRDGVQRGWRAVRFEHVEEWRLTGDHLRVRMAGEWEAVPAPASDHAALRTVLDERAAGRESPFTA